MKVQIVKKLITLAVFIVLFVLLVGLYPADYSAATTFSSPVTILDDATGGQCMLVGEWDAPTKTCSLTQDLTFGVTDGIVVGSNGITIEGRGHLIQSGAPNPSMIETHGVLIDGIDSVTFRNADIEGFYNGVVVRNSSNSTLSHSVVRQSGYKTSTYGNLTLTSNIRIISSSHITIDKNESSISRNALVLNASSNCTITDNALYANNTVLISNNSSSNNTIYHNVIYPQRPCDSCDIPAPVSVQGGTGNVFNLPLPEGGNYWEIWTSPDGNGDGIVDVPFSGGGATDYLPWVRQWGWDRTPPVVFGVFPSGQIYTTSTNIGFITYDPFPSAGSGTENLTLDGNPVAFCSSTGYGFYLPDTNVTKVTSCPLSGLSYGNHVIGGTVRDGNGNATPISGSFSVGFIDTIPPIVNYTGPTGIVRGGSAVATASFSDPAPSGGIDPESATVTLLANGITTEKKCDVSGTMSGTISCPVSGLDNADYTATISVADNGGNRTSTSGSFRSSLAAVVITDDATGGDCSTVGDWAWPTKTCTLTSDIAPTMDGIEIMADNVTLDGNGHLVSGPGPDGSGVRVSSYAGTQIRGLSLTGFDTGIELYRSDATISMNHVSSVNAGIVSWYPTGATSISSNRFSEGGVFIRYGSNVRIFDNAIISTGGGDGIITQGGGNNQFVGNVIKGSYRGIDLGGSSGDVARGNTIENSAIGIWVTSPGNTITDNTVINCILHGLEFSGSYATGAYRNNFIDNVVQLYMDDTGMYDNGTNQTLNQDAPAGGNYWSNWTQPDNDGDGFVDNPYIAYSQPGTYYRFTDYLPRTTPSSLPIAKPDLVLNRGNVYWASFSDYLVRELSVDWSVSNLGSNPAVDVAITGCANSQGVALSTPLPLSIGILGASETSYYTSRYSIPDGVSSWRTYMTASALDAGRTAYVYP